MTDMNLRGLVPLDTEDCTVIYSWSTFYHQYHEGMVHMYNIPNDVISRFFTHWYITHKERVKVVYTLKNNTNHEVFLAIFVKERDSEVYNNIDFILCFRHVH